MSSGLNGKHCNSEVWVRSIAPNVSPSGRLHCIIENCSFSAAATKDGFFRLHLRQKHWDQHEEDLDPAQSTDKVRQYFRDYFQYELSDEQVKQLEVNRKNNMARGKARRPPPRTKPASDIPEISPSSSKPSGTASKKRTRSDTPASTPVCSRRKLRLRGETSN